jgi:7-carboxy-7-deazaguanine synthase
MRISELFYSLQGEGELTGVPSVFIRTSGCNLRCTWCDTPYASWNPEGPDMSIDSILAEVERHPTPFVVLTGGEPMVASGIHELATSLRAMGKHITIETAGTIPPADIPCDLASVSPKLSHSTPSIDQAGPWHERHERTRWRPDLVAEWIQSYPYQLKFVVSALSDLAELESFLAALGTTVPPHRVLLMPQGITPQEISDRNPALIDLCKSRGYRYCARLHIDLYGNQRGT